MLNPIQLLLIIFFGVALIKVLMRYRCGELSGRSALFWMIFWIGAVVIVLRPDSTFYFAHLIGVGRGADLVVYLALAALFFMAFRLTVRIEKINREITALVREKALQEKK